MKFNYIRVTLDTFSSSCSFTADFSDINTALELLPKSNNLRETAFYEKHNELLNKKEEGFRYCLDKEAGYDIDVIIGSAFTLDVYITAVHCKYKITETPEIKEPGKPYQPATKKEELFHKVRLREKVNNINLYDEDITIILDRIPETYGVFREE